jgi:hypothetical protein
MGSLKCHARIHVTLLIESAAEIPFHGVTYFVVQ